MKTCSKCQTPKSLKDFSVCRKSADGRDGWCRTCKKNATDLWRAAHEQQTADYRKEWRRTHRPLVLAEKERYRQRHLERARQQVRAAHQKNGQVYRRRRYFALIEERYGLTEAQIQEQSQKQNHLCLLCHKKQKCGKRQRLYVDHDHTTGKFRGLLCFSCNSMLGFAKDNIEVLQEAIQYLQAQHKLFA
jgi:hypothetical protein